MPTRHSLNKRLFNDHGIWHPAFIGIGARASRYGAPAKRSPPFSATSHTHHRCSLIEVVVVIILICRKARKPLLTCPLNVLKCGHIVIVDGEVGLLLLFFLDFPYLFYRISSIIPWLIKHLFKVFSGLRILQELLIEICHRFSSIRIKYLLINSFHYRCIKSLGHHLILVLGMGLLHHIEIVLELIYAPHHCYFIVKVFYLYL